MSEFVERVLPPGSRLIGPLPSEEKITISMILRRRPDGPAMPDAAYWMDNPPGHRTFLTPEQFEQAYGAAIVLLEK